MKYLLILSAIFITVLGKAQTSLHGRFLSSDKTGISNLSVVVHHKNDINSIISYTFTDEKGQFSLEFKSKFDSLGITVRSMTHKDTTVIVANRNQTINFVLPVSNHQIREVNINARAITAQKDTITYLVGKFAHVKDQSIGDVIGNMPGFEVSAEGAVYYQGKPIQKYYIEGMDLLENRYAIANKNIPYQDVGSVEVLENHQPIKILESRAFSNQTSINLRLRRNITTTGTLQVGLGFPFLLHHLNATPMIFSKNQQTIASFQSNNTGEDLNLQDQSLQFSESQIEELENRKVNLLGVTGISTPQIESKHYLNNNANLVSVNHLVKKSDLTELKVLASFYQDNLKETGQIRSYFHLPENDYTLNEQIARNIYNSRLNTGFSLTQNVKKKYLKEQFLINRNWDHESGTIESTELRIGNAKTSATSGSNTFDLLLPVGNHFLRIYSALRFNDSPQQLLLSPGVFPNFLNNGMYYAETLQKYGMTKFTGRQFLRFTLTHKRWSFDTEPGFNFDSQHYQSSIQTGKDILKSDSLRNDFLWNNLEFYLTERINFTREKLHMGVTIPVRSVFYKMDDQLHHSIAPIGRLLFSPRFWIDYDLFRFWSMDGSIGYNVRLGDARQLSQGYIIKDYHLMQRNTDQLDEYHLFSGDLRLEYKNPVEGFFSVASCSFFQNHRNLIHKNVYLGDGLFFLDAVDHNNHFISSNFALASNYLSPNQNISLSLKCQYTDTRYAYLLNQILGWNHHQSYLIQPSIGVNSLKNLGIDYHVKLSRTYYWNNQANTTISGQVHQLAFYYYPSPIHWFGLSLEYYHFGKQQKMGSDGLFLHMGYTFKPAHSRFEYKLRCNNLLDSKRVVDYYDSDISITESSYNLRPREVVLLISCTLRRAGK